MRRRLVRNGLCFLLASLVLIILVSFFLGELASLLSLSVSSAQELYGKGIFGAAAIGGYGVVVTVLGLILSSDRHDNGIKIVPLFLMLICLIALFFYLLVSSFNSPPYDQKQSPGTSILI